MTTQRIINLTGVSESDMAHLRLLLRLARKRLRDNWVWGPESRADLVIVDTRKLIGETAMRRAAQRDVGCARIIEIDDSAPPGLHLRKPLQQDALVALLSKVEGGDTLVPETFDWEEEMVELDLGHVDLSMLEAEHPGAQRGYGPQTHAGEKRADLEPEGIADLSANLAGLVVTDNTAAHAEPEQPLEDVVPAGTKPVEETAAPQLFIDPDSTFPLSYYLEKGTLQGPSRIALPHRQSLAIDADARLFWAHDTMPILEPYAREPLRYGDWQLLDRVQLDNIRRVTVARPFERLIWMIAFVRSNGFLGKQFDAGGTFRLSNRLDLINDYPNAFRVAACLNSPRKLHEIARSSSVGLEEVFDIINAYDALGYVECTRR